jgi:outer membrane receptor protein involved in Fe transport
MVLPSRRIAQCLLGVVLAACAHTTAAAAAPIAAADGALPVDIPAQPLPQALDAFAESTGLQLIYVAELAQGRTSRPVSGGLRPSAALARLLAGTGLDFVFLNNRTVKIFAAPARAGASPSIMQEHRPAGPPSGAPELEQVVVTADKRVEAVGTVPISVAVLSGDEMEAMGVKSISDIAALTPGLQFDFSSQYGPGLLTNITIRGINDLKSAPTTGIYIDDVPVQSSFNVFRNAYPVIFDLARVEVLRGPQGTVFGSSALTGAVRFIPNEASVSAYSGMSELEVSATQQGGSGFESGAAGGGPLVPDLVGGRLSAWYRSEGGYIDRVDPFNNAIVDPDANRSTSKAVRLGLAVDPNDTLHIVPSVAYQSVDHHDTPTFYTALSDPDDGMFLNGKLLRQPYQDTFTLSAVKVEQRLGNVELTDVTAYFDRSAAATEDETSPACLAYFGSCGNALGPAYPSSYLQAVPNLLAQRQTAFSQELRLASAAPNAPLTWVTGLFYWRTHQNGTTDAYAIAAPSTPGVYSATRYFAAQISVFGQVYWTPIPSWRVGIGTRRGWARGDSTDRESGFANPSTPFSEAVGTFQPLPATPRFDLSYNVDDGNLLYVAVAKGARAGGTGTPAQCEGTAVPSSFASDAIWNYELGAKDLLFERRLQIAASLYLIRWDGIQEHVTDACGNGYTTNAGAATSGGFDLAADALLTQELRVHLALGLTDAHYDRTVSTNGGAVIVDRGTAIGSLPSVASPWTGTVSAEYRRPLTPVVVGYAAADDIFASHNPGPFTENDPRAASYSPGFRADPATNRLDLRLGWVRSSIEIRFSVQNVLNSTPVLHLDSDAIGSSLYYAYTVRPRTLALSSDWRY